MKLETSKERKGAPLLKSLSYFPSGSVVEGLGAALLGCCQMMNIKATLCVSWIRRTAAGRRHSGRWIRRTRGRGEKGVCGDGGRWRRVMVGGG
ncbi:hypothetical protein HanPI659440_Chr11g0425611 [Helianthus annuus]|nr:hypothetical protein HanPI659440_Chr11g0425611 [Helianthus annuus]